MEGIITISENIILPHIDVEFDTQILNELANRMYENGFVKETFCEAIIKREKKFPTGLKCGKYNIAIPHTESIYVEKSCIGVATIKDGVSFHRMDEPDELINVNLVVLLASNAGHEHMEMLSSIIRMIQDENVVKDLVKSENSHEVSEILKNFLTRR